MTSQTFVKFDMFCDQFSEFFSEIFFEVKKLGILYKNFGKSVSNFLVKNRKKFQKKSKVEKLENGDVYGQVELPTMKEENKLQRNRDPLYSQSNF